MAKLSQMEVNSIREVAASHQTMASKLSAYANQCQDANVKKMFSDAAMKAQQGAQNLIQML